jgi:hypothetical protein
MCRNAGLQQLPPILYQVLLLSGSTPTMRCYALRLIMSLFDLLESQQGAGAAAAGAAAGAAGAEDGEPQQQQAAANTLPSAVLMQVQATLLMHISTMLRYDGSLGSEWFKWASGEAGSSSTNYFLLQVMQQSGWINVLIVLDTRRCDALLHRHVTLAASILLS